MPGNSEPHKPDLEEVAAKLREGLRSCRSVVQNYRMMLLADQASRGEEEGIGTLLDGRTSP